MSRTWKFVAAAILSVAVLSASGCSLIKGGTPVDTATVEKIDLSVSVTASGKVEAGRRADVYPPTAGSLVAVYVEEGDTVKAGDKLAQMEPTALEAAVESAKAQVAQAKATLETVNNAAPAGPDYEAASAGVCAAEDAYHAAKVAYAAVDNQAPSSAQKAAANQSVAAAQIAYDNATWSKDLAYTVWQSDPTSMTLEAAYRSAQTGQAQAKSALYSAKAAKDSLYATDLSAAKAQAHAAVEQSYAALKTAQANDSKLRRTSVSAQRAAARAAQKAAASALALAQANLKNGTITAPIDGTVFFNPVSPSPQADGQAQVAAEGAGVSPQMPPFTVADLSGSTFVAEVDEADIARVKDGMNASIQFDAYPSDDVKTTVTRVQPAARTTATGGTVFPVDLGLSDVALNLLIGMKGDASIKVKSIPTALVIPIEALFDENGTTFVYVVTPDNKLKKTEIKVGAQTDTQVQVSSGLDAGQTVALSGSTELKDGMEVKPNKQ